MDLSPTELMAGIGGVGGLTAGFNKYVIPLIKAQMKSKSEENKLKIKMSSSGEVADIWKTQYEEAKEELKEVNQHKIELEVRAAQLQMKVDSLKERLIRYTKDRGGVLSVKPDKKNKTKKTD